MFVENGFSMIEVDCIQTFQKSFFLFYIVYYCVKYCKIAFLVLYPKCYWKLPIYFLNYKELHLILLYLPMPLSVHMKVFFTFHTTYMEQPNKK